MLVDIQLSTPGAHNEQRGVSPANLWVHGPTGLKKWVNKALGWASSISGLNVAGDMLR